MIKFTTNMSNCLEKMQNEVLNSFNDEDRRDIKSIIMKPTKRKEFKAIVINFNKPCFQFFINDRFVATYFFNQESKKWNVEE